jgi:predicted DNA-binding transcriptional regulator YafY
MRRADRLFQIVLCLRRRKAVTAEQIAQELEVSVRTIYRDIRDLMASGVPVDGEAGVGYRLRAGFDLPPLMFNAEELQALRLGAEIVRGWADPELARAARTALERIEAVLPERLQTVRGPEPFYVPDFFIREETKNFMAELRRAVQAKQQVRIGYTREDGTESVRQVEPVGLFFWGNRWTLGAWCNLRGGFRTFRLDRIDSLEVLPGESVGHDAEEYIRLVSREE